jgi:hypothetical protein
LLDKSSLLYSRHFFTPLECSHPDGRTVHGTVSNTYEAELWEEGKENYSFLPLDRRGEKLTVPLSALGEVRRRIEANLSGKRPVDLSSEEMAAVVEQIRRRTQIKVVGNIKLKQKRGRPSGCGPCNGHGHSHHGQPGHKGHRDC